MNRDFQILLFWSFHKDRVWMNIGINREEPVSNVLYLLLSKHENPMLPSALKTILFLKYIWWKHQRRCLYIKWQYLPIHGKIITDCYYKIAWEPIHMHWGYGSPARTVLGCGITNQYILRYIWSGYGVSTLGPKDF